MKQVLLILVAIQFIGCGASPEGTTPGDCSDGKDNDANGFVDCEDKLCVDDDHCLRVAAQAQEAAQAVAKSKQDAIAEAEAEKATNALYVPLEKLWVQKAFSEGDMNWATAEKYCENMTLADKDDWRLPTTNEAIQITGSDLIPKGDMVMWSSEKNKKRATIIGMSTGAVNEIGVVSKGDCRARCVRDN